MSKSLIQQRMLQNEAVFRRYNERLKIEMDKLKAIAKEDGQEDLIPDHDLPLYFVCECSDENCKQRVQLKPSQYNRIHADRRQFVVVDGHEAVLVERVVRRTNNYTVVKKVKTPPESAATLQLTPIDNVG